MVTQVAEVDRVYGAVEDCRDDVLGKTEWRDIEVRNYFNQMVGGDEVPEVYPQTKTRFRLLDDDGIPYFGGWLLNDEWCAVQQTVLSWGTWYAGCTTIEVRDQDNEWTQEIA